MAMTYKWNKNQIVHLLRWYLTNKMPKSTYDFIIKWTKYAAAQLMTPSNVPPYHAKNTFRRVCDKQTKENQSNAAADKQMHVFDEWCP